MTETEVRKEQARLMKALGHPLRQRALEELSEREASPTMLAQLLGVPLPNVAYHVKVLVDSGAIELAYTQPVRGALEHFYRATSRPFIDDENWARLPAAIRSKLFDQTLNKIWAHLAEAAETGGLDSPETHISWTTLDLDRIGYKRVVKILERALEDVLEAQSESASRLTAVDEDQRVSERTEVVFLHYHRPRESELEASDAD